jgi:hypothetical protein
MLTRKHLRRARRKMAANPAHALAVRDSLRARLAASARWSPDESERAAAGIALSVLSAHAWAGSGFDELGVPAPRRPVPAAQSTSAGGARFERAERSPIA